MEKWNETKDTILESDSEVPRNDLFTNDRRGAVITVSPKPRVATCHFHHLLLFGVLHSPHNYILKLCFDLRSITLPIHLHPDCTGASQLKSIPNLFKCKDKDSVTQKHHFKNSLTFP